MNKKGFSLSGVIGFVAIMVFTGFYIKVFQPVVLNMLSTSTHFSAGTEGYIIFSGIPFVLILIAFYFLIRQRPNAAFG